MFSFLAKQELARKCLLDACDSKTPEPARELSTEALSHPRLQTLFRELHSGKVDSPGGTNHSPNAPLLSKATLAFFSPSPLVSIGQRGSGLPLAPWTLLFFWWSPELESHSKRVLLRGEAGFAIKSPSLHRPQQSTLSWLGRSTPKANFTNGSKLASGSGTLESETLFQEQTIALMFLC